MASDPGRVLMTSSACHPLSKDLRDDGVHYLPERAGLGWVGLVGAVFRSSIMRAPSVPYSLGAGGIDTADALCA